MPAAHGGSDRWRQGSVDGPEISLWSRTDCPKICGSTTLASVIVMPNRPLVDIYGQEDHPLPQTDAEEARGAAERRSRRAGGCPHFSAGAVTRLLCYRQEVTGLERDPYSHCAEKGYRFTPRSCSDFEQSAKFYRVPPGAVLGRDHRTRETMGAAPWLLLLGRSGRYSAPPRRDEDRAWRTACISYEPGPDQYPDHCAQWIQARSTSQGLNSRRSLRNASLVSNTSSRPTEPSLAYAATGHGAWEAALVNLFSPGGHRGPKADFSR